MRWSRWAEVAATARVGVPAARLWDEISRPGHLVDDHPYIAAHTVDRWPGAGSRDRLVYLNGLRMQRDVAAWRPGAGYDLLIGRGGRVDAEISWRVAPLDAEASQLTITARPRLDGLLRGVPRALQPVGFAVRGRPLLRRYLHAVVDGFRHHLETGEPVPRDSPRPHPWFSAPLRGTGRTTRLTGR